MQITKADKLRIVILTIALFIISIIPTLITISTRQYNELWLDTSKVFAFIDIMALIILLHINSLAKDK